MNNTCVLLATAYRASHTQTKNNWDDRGSFVKYKGKYGLVETDENDDDDGDGTGDASLGKLSEDQIHKV